MKYFMKVSNVQDVHFYVVQSVLIIFILLIKIIVLFVDIKKSNVGLLYLQSQIIFTLDISNLFPFFWITSFGLIP